MREIPQFHWAVICLFSSSFSPGSIDFLPAVSYNEDRSFQNTLTTSSYVLGPDQVIEVLEKAGARAVRLGVAKAQNARVITSKEEIRYLDRPAPDELARWQKDYKKCEK